MNCEECEKKQKRINDLERLNQQMAESIDRVFYGIKRPVEVPVVEPEKQVNRMPHSS